MTTKTKRPARAVVPLPSRDEIIAFIARERDAVGDKTPAKIGKREIARAFQLQGADKIALKHLLKELEAEGAVERKGKALAKPGTLPATVLAEIYTRDRDGDLLAKPVDWDEALGRAPTIAIHIPRRPRPGTPMPGLGDRALVRTEIVRDAMSSEPGYTGRIVKILAKANRSQVLGIYRAGPGTGGQVFPVDKKSANRGTLAVSAGDEGDAQDGDLVAVDILRGGRLGPPNAKVRERIGSFASEKAVSLIAIHTHKIPSVFQPATITEAEAARPATMTDREDWRALPLVTIDPPDAKDHDDAVHAEPDPHPENEGGFILTVAIADVAAYVRPRSALDREALERGNSVYFPDRVVPMLPERISNDLCSLRAGEDRPALAMRMVIDAEGRKRRHTLHRIMMRSHAKLAYAQAQAAIDGHPDETTRALVTPVLVPLYAAYEALKRAKAKRQPLDLDLPERKILLHEGRHGGSRRRAGATGRASADRGVHDPRQRRRRRTAGRAPAKADLSRAWRAVRREAAQSRRIPADDRHQARKRPGADAGAVQRYFGQGAGHRARADRQRRRAALAGAGRIYRRQLRPFRLHLRRYAHFTSPIRRYADLVVHRALIRAEKLGPDGQPDMETDELADISERISAAERRAMAAERETIDRLIATHLVDKVGATFGGRIAGVTRAGLFVKLADTGADGFIPAATLGDEFFRYEEAQHALVGSRSGMTLAARRQRHRQAGRGSALRGRSTVRIGGWRNIRRGTQGRDSQRI